MLFVSVRGDAPVRMAANDVCVYLASQLNTSPPGDLAQADLTDFNIYPLAETEPPACAQTEIVVEVEPLRIAGVWTQQWQVVPRPTPAAVSMRQARLALLSAGLLAAVDAAIASMPSPEREAAQIEWEYAAEVRRDSPLIAALAPALDLTGDQIDALFVAAVAL